MDELKDKHKKIPNMSLWVHVLDAQPSVNVVQELIDITPSNFNYAHVFDRSEIRSVASEIVEIMSGDVNGRRPDLISEYERPWRKVWFAISKDSSDWTTKEWDVVIQTIFRTSFNATECGVQNNILNLIPEKVWLSMSKERLRTYLEDSLRKKDLNCVKKLISMNADMDTKVVTEQQFKQVKDTATFARHIFKSSILCSALDLDSMEFLLQCGADPLSKVTSTKDIKDVMGSYHVGLPSDYEETSVIEYFSSFKVNGLKEDVQAEMLKMLRRSALDSLSEDKKIELQKSWLLRAIKVFNGDDFGKRVLRDLMLELPPGAVESWNLGAGLNVARYTALLNPSRMNVLMNLCGLYGKDNGAATFTIKDEYGLSVAHYMLMSQNRDGYEQDFYAISKEGWRDIMDVCTPEGWEILVTRCLSLWKRGAFNPAHGAPMAIFKNNNGDALDSSALKLMTVMSLMGKTLEKGGYLDSSMRALDKKTTVEMQWLYLDIAGATKSVGLIEGFTGITATRGNCLNGNEFINDEVFAIRWGLDYLRNINKSLKVTRSFDDILDELQTDVISTVKKHANLWRLLENLFNGEHKDFWLKELKSDNEESKNFWKLMQNSGEAAMLMEGAGIKKVAPINKVAL